MFLTTSSSVSTSVKVGSLVVDIRNLASYCTCMQFSVSKPLIACELCGEAIVMYHTDIKGSTCLTDIRIITTKTIYPRANRHR